MAFVNEAAPYGAGAAVHIFIRAPDGKVDVPVVQLEWNVADCVSEIPANGDAFRLRVRRDGIHVEELAGVELNAGKEEKRSLGSMLVDDRQDVLCGQNRVVFRRRLDEDHGLIDVKAMVSQLRFHGVLVLILAIITTSLIPQQLT